MHNGESSYRRFVEGDQSAFDELMDAYRDRLIFFIKGYVGSAEEAQDIAMDTFVEILVHPGRFRFKSSFKTYIYSVARHKAVDFLRKKRTVPDSGKEIWDESAIDSFYRREDARTVRECMDRLNGDYRTVLYLVYFEEVDGDGAAKIMGKSKKQLANLLYRAKQALKTELEKEAFAMKTGKEFRDEVYARASKERARIKRRNRVIMTAVPCFVIAIAAAATAVYCSNLLPTKEAAPISVAGYNTSEKNVDSLDDTEQTPTEVQKPGGTGDFAYETVAEGASAAKNDEPAAPTKNNDKTGEAAALGYDFKAFSDKAESNKNGTHDNPDVIVIKSKKELEEYLAAQEKYGALSEELKAELLSKDDGFFGRNTVAVIAADSEYELVNCRANSDGTLTVSVKKKENVQGVGCHMLLTVYNRQFNDIVLTDT